ncbi:DUF4382 domain-containing protein [Carboxylicivirga taeanensis]|uniref:DUF4382 domain-containing protein n=1 Tax=Carboxylicivirga taeanensis TaxID=1416875 RepID=UPI003F6DE2EA
MNTRIINLSLAAVLGMAAVACSSDENDMPELTNATLELRTADLSLKSAETISFSEAIIQVEEVEFESIEVDDDDIEVDFDGPFTIDLLSGASTPDIPSSFLFPAKYEEVELELNDDVSPNMLISGIVSVDESTTIPFVFKCDEEIEFEAEAEEDGQAYLFEVIEGTAVDIVMEFPLTQWFEGIDFVSGSLNDDNTLVLSKSENGVLYNQVIQNIEQSKLMVSTK